MTVESNPGPAGSIKFGFWNARGATHKGANIIDIINEHRLDALAICESWIPEHAPEAVKHDMVPPGYSVQHVSRHGANKGGGLALIHSSQLTASAMTVSSPHTAYEVQLVTIQVSRTPIQIANIYRPPSLSKVTFIDEFAELLASIGLAHNNRLILCGDFNLPGPSSCECD